MCAHLDTWPALSSRFHKADLSESFYIGAEEYKRFLSDIEIDVLNLKVERPVKPYLKGSAKRLVHKGISSHKKLGVGKIRSWLKHWNFQ